MASILADQKLAQGAKRLAEIEREISAEIISTKEQISAAQAKLASLQDIYEDVAERSTSINNFLTLPRFIRRNHSNNQKLLRPVAGYELESAEKEVLPAPLLSAPSPPPIHKKRKARDEPTGIAPPPKRSKRGQDYLDACSTILKTPSGNYVELRCPICNGNTEPQKGRYYKGPAGLQKHLQTNHEEKTSLADIVGRCWHRVVPDGEVEKIVAGESEVEKVVGTAESRISPARKVKGGTAAAKPPEDVAAKGLKAKGMEGKAEVEVGLVAEKEEGVDEDELVRPSDSVPSSEVNRARLAKFRVLQGRYFRA